MSLLLILIVVILVFGGGWGFYGHNRYGYGMSFGPIVGLLLLVLLLKVLGLI